MTLPNLRELHCEKTIGEQFVRIVASYLSNSPPRKDEITDDLFLLIEFCNHHRKTLWTLYRDGATADQHALKTWLSELATPPSGEWAELRLFLNPFIRAFGMLPRPRGTRLFSPLDEDLAETGLTVREIAPIGEHALTTVRDDGSLKAAATAETTGLTTSGVAGYSITQGGMSGNPTYTMTSGSAGEPGIDVPWPPAARLAKWMINGW